MTYVKDFLKCVVLGMAAFALFWVWLSFAHVSQAAADLSGTALAARLLIGEIRSELPVMAASVDAQAGRALDQVAILRTDLNTRLDTLSGKLDAPLDAATAVLDNAAGIRQDLAPLLDEAAGTAAIARLTIRDLRPQLLGLVAASKVTAGETATAMRDVQRAVPGILATAAGIQADIKRTTEASAKASEATALTMQNFAKATKPLPTWARIGLAVAPPLVGVGSTIVMTLAVTGK